MCADCAAEVDAQKQAREALRDSLPIDMPSSLLGLLSQIPHAPIPPPEGPQSPVTGELAPGESRPRRRRR
jgi:hypothetical protein